MKMNFDKKATALAMSVLFAVSMAGCGSSASTAKKSRSNIRRGSGRSEDWCTDRNNR